MMNETEWHRTRRWMTLGVVAFLILIGVGIAISAVLFALRPAGTPVGFYPFPFGFGWFFGLFFIFFIFWGLRWWAWGAWGRRSWHYPYSYGRRDSAHAILRERYARGEIGKDQYEQMMRDLEQHN